MFAKAQESVRFRKLFMNIFKTVHEQVCQKGFGKLITLTISIREGESCRTVVLEATNDPYAARTPWQELCEVR